jgi:hypothetical protein
MKKTLREQIYQNMDLKETDELLDIWHEHNTYEWRQGFLKVIAVEKKRPSSVILLFGKTKQNRGRSKWSLTQQMNGSSI